MTTRNPLSPIAAPATPTAAPTDMAAMQAEMQRLLDENKKLKAKKITPITCKIGQKGGVSVYGIQRFPVTLYGEQWDRLIKFISAPNGLSDFLAANRSELATKDNPRVVEATPKS